MSVNPSTMRLGIASILIGLCGAYGVRVMMEEEPEPEATPARKFAVPIASANLPAGRRVVKGDIAFRQMTEAEMKEEGWQASLVMMDENFIIGRETKRPIQARHPFLTTDVWLEGEGQEYSVTPGMRAAPIRVPEELGGYQATVGDIVDVFFTSTPQQNRQGEMVVPEKTILITEAAKVLHVDEPTLSEIHWAMGYKAKAPILTLEVEPDVAGKIYTLQRHGDFSLMVRSGDEPRGRKSPGSEYTLADLLGIEEAEPPQQPPVVSVEYWYGRQRTYKYFPMPEAQPVAEQYAQRSAPEREDVLPDTGGSATRSQTPREAAPPANNAQPRIPYRPDEPPARTPAPAADASDNSASTPNAATSGNPFEDDGDVLP